jgi:transcriptional regulator with XRE-family HTH domain
MAMSDMSDSAILKELGARVQQERLNLDVTQAEVARKAGISRGALRLLEAGRGSTLASLIRVLRALDRLSAFDSFLPAPGPSPVQLARLKGRPRQRASGAGRKKIVEEG